SWKSDPRDMALLRDTWTEDFETLYVLGSKMYMHIFNQCPTIKKLFPFIAKYEATGRDFTEDAEFRTQALRLVQIIAKVVEREANLDGLETFLYKLGYRHVQYLSDALKPQYWEIFRVRLSTEDRERAILVDCIVICESNLSFQVWKDVVVYVVSHMKEGYNDALKGKNRFPTAMI
ncbi:hypothetical protein PENTCL1PPCAC_16089, partial [Pristionchus entomophagus]